MTTEQRRLWKQAFGDTDAFLDLFERTAYAPDRCHTLTVEHCLAAALYWLDCETAGEKTAYIYAVATDERFRGRGLCRRLMTETHTRLQGEGYASAVLVAASPSLSEMYRKMGYLPLQTVGEIRVPAAEAAAVLETLTPSEFAARRRRLLPPDGVVQEGENLRFFAAQYHFYATADCLLAARREGDRLVVTELLGTPPSLGGIVTALGCREGVFRLPQGDRPFALWLPLTEAATRPSYFGWAFD